MIPRGSWQAAAVVACRAVFTARPIFNAALALAAFGCWCLPGAAAADPVEVERLIREGVALRRAHSDQEALPLFQRAYGLAATPRAAAQLGLVELALGYLLDAERHLAESLAVPRDIWVKGNRKALDKAFARLRARIGEVVVSGGPPGAAVKLNGAVAGKLPLPAPLRAAEGRATVEVAAVGFRAASQVVTVKGGEQTKLAVDLEALPSSPTSAVPLPPTRIAGPAPIPTPSELAPARMDDTSRDDTSPIARKGTSLARPAAWILAAGAAGAVGFGVFETVAWWKRKNDFENHSSLVPGRSEPLVDCGEKVASRGGPECQALYDRAARAKTLLMLGYACGGALAVGAAILFVVASPPGDSETSHALACGPTLPLRGATCRLSF
jgi:PEGA domain